MTNESKYIVELTNMFLQGKTPILKTDIDYYKLFELAKAHNLTAVIFAAIKNSADFSMLPNNVQSFAGTCFYDSIYNYENQKRCIENIFKILSYKNIKHVFFKGAILKELYPVPECRVMGDIDVLVAPFDKASAKKALIAGGYTCVAQNGPVVEFRKGDMSVELHTSVTGAQEEYEKAFGDIMSTAEYEGCCAKPNDTLHFAYLIAHIAHHFLFYGAGIRMILDLAVMLKQCDININEVLERCDKIGIKQFACVILSLCYEWYGVGKYFCSVPNDCVEFIVNHGVFGNYNHNKSAVLTRRELAKNDTKCTKLLKLRLLFPSYGSIKNIPYIRFINGRPWLLPYAWIYRIIYNLIHRKKFMVNSVKGFDSPQSKEQAQREMNMLKEIGLQ